jgi:hypothetical protein
MRLLNALILTTLICGGVATAVVFALSNLAEAKQTTPCECSELRAIRRILEQQFQVTCDERRCLPVPTPTANDGGSLP